MTATATRTVRTDPVMPTATRLGPVYLAVTSAEKALAIWRDVVGLEVIAQTDSEIRLGAGGTVLIVLEPGAARPVVPRTTGLYHVAIHVTERAELARFVLRAAEARIRFSPTDHLVSEAVYVWDHDGNGIEITHETPWRGTLENPDETGGYGMTADGKPHSGREPIDLDDLMSELDDPTAFAGPMKPGTRIGHVHVHVTDLHDAMAFYADTLGFGRQLLSDSFGMGDVMLDYAPHIFAFNVWAGPDAVPAPSDAAGLRRFTMIVPDAETEAALRGRLAEAGCPIAEMDGGFETRDPSGNRLCVEVAG